MHRRSTKAFLCPKNKIYTNFCPTCTCMNGRKPQGIGQLEGQGTNIINKQ